MDMLTFEQKFTKELVVEASKPAPIPEPEVSDEEAFKKQLDPQTDPAAFDVQPNPQISAQVAQTNKMLQSLQSWITEIEGWVQRLNGLDPNSIQSQLNSADCDTIFTPIARSETKKVSRIAQDLSGLAESLKGHLMSADTSV